MKKLNERQNNKGFSLVELIVVIAIMVVLVAVLAPVFSKYIESSRRSTDVQNANSIAEAVLADAADGRTITNNAKPTAINEWPIKTRGDAVAVGKEFKYTYDADTNHCSVTVDGAKATSGGDLTIEGNAKVYKDAKQGEF